MNILVSGGAGYIGSHCVQRLLRDGHRVVSYDNLFRGHRRPMELLGEEYPERLTFVEGDLRETDRLEALLREHAIETIMHFAAWAYVGESVQMPLAYWRNNTVGSLSLIEAADRAGVQRFVFSSTCATYGEPASDQIPIRETCPQHPINPYGQSKLAVEKILIDWVRSCTSEGRPCAVCAPRYFNVAGCDRTGLLGEDHEPETHLIPVILEAAMGKRDAITIFGTDYPTPDGTCIRDYIHVEDLIDAHVRAMEALEPGDTRFYNLGIGNGLSVREIIDACRDVTGVDFPVKEGPRRAGDPPVLYADPSKIRNELGWSASITDVREIVASAWNWFQSHPDGYGDTAGA